MTNRKYTFMNSNLLNSDATLYIVIGLLIFNYMLIKHQRNNLKKFMIVFYLLIYGEA